ncbi:MAG TPA: ferritin family protein [Desulfatiglandales bacterium]|nr:ferritin family protein [Desulfatiglandales bacterium]
MTDQLTLRKAIQFAVKTEELGARFYRSLSEKFSGSPVLKELFSRLAKDEIHHKDQFNALLEDLPEVEEAPGADDKYEFLKVISVSEFFDESAQPDIVDEIKTKDAALAKAFDFEKAALLYYQGVQDIIGKNEKLTAIINMEKDHVLSIMKNMIAEGSKFRGLSDRW